MYFAAPPAPRLDAPPPDPPKSHWYGYQTLLVDLATVPVWFVPRGGPVIGLGGYLVGAPIVHAAHARPLAAVGSLGLRFLMPVLAAEIACAGPRCAEGTGGGERESNLDVLVPAVLGGAVAAVALDAGLLGWESTPEPRTEAASTWESIHVGVSADPRTHAGRLDVSGMF